jgi:tripartite ATP-independent transporter DctP family solute receptor
MNIKSFFRVCILGIVIGFISITGASAKTVIKFATGASGDHIDIEIANRLAAEIEKRVPGKVEFKIFPGGQLGKQKAVMSGLQRGTHQLSLSASPMASIEPMYGVFEAPFLFANRTEVIKVLDALSDDIKRSVLKKNVKVIAIGSLGFRQISNNVRAIVKPADLDGVKLRTPGNPFRIETFKTFGANPTPMSFGEVYVALRQGVIDGQENPLGSIWGGKFHEVQKHISMSNHIFTPNSLVASKMVWDTWPKEVQDAVQDAGESVMRWSFERDLERETSLRGKMEEFSEFNNIDTDAFKKAAAPLYPKIKTKVGDDIWAKVEAALN